MTVWHVLVVIVFAFFFLLGYFLHVTRPPWYGRLGTWKLDKAVRRSSWRRSYFPLPEFCDPIWKVPEPFCSYCLRCGRYPYSGLDLMVSKQEGFRFIYFQCFHASGHDDLVRYAHQIIDIKICQNFDPRFIHPDSCFPITHFTGMFRAAMTSLVVLELMG